MATQTWAVPGGIWPEASEWSAARRPVDRYGPRDREGFDATIERAFLAAHLLTGSRYQAENVVVEAVDSWDPQESGGEELFDTVLKAAAARAPSGTVSAGLDLPPVLRRVLDLEPEFRRPFVLRLLLGLSRRRCAALLGLSCSHLDDLVCTAARRLACGRSEEKG